jgi:pyruvate dehydrogenase (quinone)
MTDADPVNPMRIFHELSMRLPSNAIVAADSGSAANWYARHLRVHGDVRGSLSGTLATMGPAVPYAIGAKFAHPDRPAIAITGDGAMQMNGMAELLTIARYRERWDDQRLVVAVLHNNDLNQVTWELRAMGGAPKFEESQVLPDLSYADFASSIGLDGITVRDPNDLGPAWERALESSGPTVLDVHCDPEVPPIPPHATLEEAVSMVEAVLKGDRSSLHLMMQGIKTKLQEVLP